ncbi:hypothetical protein Tco_0272307 [Tanacetum coccineum]
MINHTQAKAVGKLSNVLCQVGVTTINAKFLILDIPIDHDAPIVVGQGFIHTIRSILNASERIFSTFDGICHQTFCATRFDVLRTAESDSDHEEEYVIKRNKFGAPNIWPETHSISKLYQSRRSIISYTNRCNRDAKSRYNTRLAQLLPRHIYSPCIVNWDVLNQMGRDGEIDDMLRIRVREAESKEEIPKWICKCSLGDCEMDEEERSWDSERESNLLWDLDTITLRYLIDSDGKLIPEDPQPDVPRVGIPRPSRASIQDLYDRMGRIEIRQDAIERMEYRLSYYWDKYHGVFEHMAGVYSVPLQRAYNPPDYAQPQYDQYY